MVAAVAAVAAVGGRRRGGLGRTRDRQGDLRVARDLLARADRLRGHLAVGRGAVGSSWVRILDRSKPASTSFSIASSSCWFDHVGHGGLALGDQEPHGGADFDLLAGAGVGFDHLAAWGGVVDELPLGLQPDRLELLLGLAVGVALHVGDLRDRGRC